MGKMLSSCVSCWASSLRLCRCGCTKSRRPNDRLKHSQTPQSQVASRRICQLVGRRKLLAAGCCLLSVGSRRVREREGEGEGEGGCDRDCPSRLRRRVRDRPVQAGHPLAVVETSVSLALLPCLHCPSSLSLPVFVTLAQLNRRAHVGPASSSSSSSWSSSSPPTGLDGQFGQTTRDSAKKATSQHTFPPNPNEEEEDNIMPEHAHWVIGRGDARSPDWVGTPAQKRRHLGRKVVRVHSPTGRTASARPSRRHEFEAARRTLLPSAGLLAATATGHHMRLNRFPSDTITLRHTESCCVALILVCPPWVTLRRTESYWVSLRRAESCCVALILVIPPCVTLLRTESYWFSLRRAESCCVALILVCPPRVNCVSLRCVVLNLIASHCVVLDLVASG
ncbi:unnamed protein product [Protopolystoma xenopodis]|uniref:Uncharacterized protein n=1 Tax=Protopolystoma xenopodis TaxID=117903 RepID=A0A3S5CRL7_9PLAT|nr:unnamed protein product [Protopolystoma xenopodis]